MEWYVEPRDVAAVTELRHQLTAYVRRHAEPGADVDGATLAFSELLTNAVRHTDGPAWVVLDWSRSRLRVEIHDLGVAFRLEPEIRRARAAGHHGLYLASQLGERLTVAAKRAGGKVVSAMLPVARPDAGGVRSPRVRQTALPSLEDADMGGAFGKEAFLRALVVQLAEAVEHEHGPAAAEQAVAQVGADVGGRMEEAYRRAEAIAGLLTPEQMADLYVRLKRAIDGDFYLVEADERRIVLGNRRCPFGEVVKRSPGLCAMTSSVFGGVAARNAGEATVTLEERIAVGDAECRVVVWLGEPPEDAAGVGQRYRAPA